MSPPLDPNPWNHYGPHPLLHISQQLNISLNGHLQLPVASTSVAGTEGALSETETVEVAQVRRDNIKIEEGPVNQIPGWAHLQQEIIHSIVEGIHTNPVYFDHLVARFPDQDKIFGTPIEAWRGLHRVCRRLEARQLERLEAEVRADENNNPDSWEAYIQIGRAHV